MRALCLAGGGSNGDGQCGFVDYLYNEEVSPGFRAPYDLLAGVSTGALTAAKLAEFPAGQEREAVAAMAGVYRGLKNNGSIYTHDLLWPEDRWETNSLYDATPLHRLVRSLLDPAKVATSGRHLAMGATEIGGGIEEAYRTFVDPRGEELIEAVLASSAYPFGFPMVRVGGKTYSDGGLCRPVPLQDCIDLGATEIDVVLTAPRARISDAYDPDNTNLLETGKHLLNRVVDRVLELSLLYHLATCTPDIKVRWFAPPRPLGDSLAFGSDKAPSHETNWSICLDAARIQAKEQP